MMGVIGNALSALLGMGEMDRSECRPVVRYVTLPLVAVQRRVRKTIGRHRPCRYTGQGAH